MSAINRRLIKTGILGTLFVVVLFYVSATHAAPAFSRQVHKVHAIPAFSRQYQTSCSTCHLDFPKLNDFGKAFKDAGFKFPPATRALNQNPASHAGRAGTEGPVSALDLARHHTWDPARGPADEYLLPADQRQPRQL